MTKACGEEIIRKPTRRTLSSRGRRRIQVESGLSMDQAIREARRCLGLGECDSCEVCSLLCPDLCITRDAETGEVRIDLDYCKGCGICASVCPKGAIQMVLEEGYG